MYAVFGVTKSVARSKAIKKIEKQGYDEKKFPLYDDALKACEEEMFSKLGAAQLSPAYSSRSLAEQYVELAKKDGARALKIQKRIQVGFDAVKEQPILAWSAA